MPNIINPPDATTAANADRNECGARNLDLKHLALLYTEDFFGGINSPDPVPARLDLSQRSVNKNITHNANFDKLPNVSQRVERPHTIRADCDP